VAIATAWVRPVCIWLSSDLMNSRLAMFASSPFEITSMYSADSESLKSTSGLVFFAVVVADIFLPFGWGG